MLVDLEALDLVEEQDIGGRWGDATALFDSSRTYRYVLTRTWNPALPTTAFIMCNPSTADAFQVDPTVNRCLTFARGWGSGSLIVLNAFALRSTQPEALYTHDDPVGPLNDHLILRALEHYSPEQTIAAWGIHADAVGRPKDRRARRLWHSREHHLKAMLGRQLHALAVTKGGQPGHPLYLPGLDHENYRPPVPFGGVT